jgi:hypothetical protein
VLRKLCKIPASGMSVKERPAPQQPADADEWGSFWRY